DPGDELLHRAALFARQAGERLVEEQHARLLRERHGDLEAALLAVRHFRHRPLREMLEADKGQHASRFLVESRFRRKNLPALLRQAEERERDVVLESVLREERDDLVGAREAEVDSPVRGKFGNSLFKQDNLSAVLAKI